MAFINKKLIQAVGTAVEKNHETHSVHGEQSLFAVHGLFAMRTKGSSEYDYLDLNLLGRYYTIHANGELAETEMADEDEGRSDDETHYVAVADTQTYELVESYLAWRLGTLDNYSR